jgi:hypothetical protein
MLDHYRICLGGTRIINATFDMADLLDLPAAKNWRCRYQVWPKDVDLRRNMMSTGWKNLPTMISSADVVIMNTETEEPIQQEVVLAAIQESNCGAAIRFAVIVGEDQNIGLQLQGLPASDKALMGKPAYRG